MQQQDEEARNDARNREARLLRVARRRGLIVKKCRLRTPEDPRYGQYWIIDPYSNTIVDGGDFGLDLGEVEEALRG